jgi:succinate dehydrogenase / fumarate reductase flavoprotein subunit
MEADIIKADILIIGGGIAGFRAAVEACDLGAQVVMTTKGLWGKDAGATWMAYNGYQCWGIHPHDTIDVAVEDTIKCGWFLNNQENVYAFLAHVPNTARELLRWGGRFKMKEGQFAPVWQLGQSISEGRSLTPAQWPRGELGYNYSRIFPRVLRTRKVEIMEDFFAVDLLTIGDVVVGALGFDIKTGRFKVFRAKATILATGGYQGLYQVSTANVNLTGDGHAMALRAGVDMMDFEFNQTLPSALWPPELSGAMLPFNLIMEWDARMYNRKQERFMLKWDPKKMERSTRSLISRGIFHEIKEGNGSPHGGVYVSATHNSEGFMKEKLEQWKRSRDFVKLRRVGFDLFRDPIETGYSIHYCQGGCSVNTRCETDKPGLYAIGEVASGSKDGSDRMMSNALPYCMAMGIIAGREAAQRAREVEIPEVDHGQVEELKRRALEPLERENGVRVYPFKSHFQEMMHRETGYGRTEEGLRLALNEIGRYKKDVVPRLWVSNKEKRFNFEWINVLESMNLLLVGEALIRNALMRTESRGLHDRWDYPKPGLDWFKNIHIRWVNGGWDQWTTPVEFKYWKPEEGSLGEPWSKAVRVKEYTGWRAEPLHRGI